ncbi:MAG: hypothetical protein JJ979_02530 [Roseibium sp.]|nr:hypothetical protein [Roseibium sp.]
MTVNDYLSEVHDARHIIHDVYYAFRIPIGRPGIELVQVDNDGIHKIYCVDCEEAAIKDLDVWEREDSSRLYEHQFIDMLAALENQQKLERNMKQEAWGTF